MPSLHQKLIPDTLLRTPQLVHNQAACCRNTMSSSRQTTRARNYQVQPGNRMGRLGRHGSSTCSRTPSSAETTQPLRCRHPPRSQMAVATRTPCLRSHSTKSASPETSQDPNCQSQLRSRNRALLLLTVARVSAGWERTWRTRCCLCFVCCLASSPCHDSCSRSSSDPSSTFDATDRSPSCNRTPRPERQSNTRGRGESRSNTQALRRTTGLLSSAGLLGRRRTQCKRRGMAVGSLVRSPQPAAQFQPAAKAGKAWGETEH